MTNEFKPQQPFVATASSTLSQDIVMTDNILADAQSASPVAMIINPCAGGIPGNSQPEALAIVTREVDGESVLQLCHVARTTDKEGGWMLNPLFSSLPPVEVAAGTNRSRAPYASVYAFFTAGEGDLYYSSLKADGSNWENCKCLNNNIENYSGIHNLQVTYTPSNGNLILYGNTRDGNLITVYPQTNPAEPPTVNVCNMDGALLGNSFRLCMTDEHSWYLLVSCNNQPVLYKGELSGKTPDASQVVNTFIGEMGKVVLGYWSPATVDHPAQAMWLYIDTSQQLQVGTIGGQTLAPWQIVNTNKISLTEAAGYVSAADGSLHVYYIDNTAEAGLWVMHQLSLDDGWDQNGLPVFAPAIPLGTGVSGLVCDTNPRNNAGFFALDAADYSLRLHTQDLISQHWNSYKLTTPSMEVFELVRFRTELSLSDANGTPLCNYPVGLNVAVGNSSCEASVMGSALSIGEKPTRLTTDAAGRVTLSVLATNGISIPAMELTADGLPASFAFQPAGYTHAYLSGKVNNYNPFNPGGGLPAFDTAGSTLMNATTPDNVHLYDPASGAPVDTAAQAIAMGAQVGLNSTPAGLAGFYAAAPGYSTQSFHSFYSLEEMETFLCGSGFQGIYSPGSIWDDIGGFFGDIWEGIKNGVIKIKDAAVTIADKMATLTLAIGEDIIKGVRISIAGLEKAAHFIAGIFSWIGAEITMVIDWLKALFDFPAIVRTTRVFETGLQSMPGYITQLAQTWKTDIDNWFNGLEDTLDDAFAKMKRNYADRTFGNLQGFHSPGQGGSEPGIGTLSTRDFVSHVHHNWILDKINAYSGKTPPWSSLTATPSPWADFKTLLGQSGADMLAAIDDFKKAVLSIVHQPASIATTGIADFADMVHKMTDALLKLCNAAADGFFALAGFFMDELDKLLSAPIKIAPLQALWKHISKSKDPLTVSTLLSLMAAFPVTVIYKLLKSGAEPFPPHTPNPFSHAGLPRTGYAGVGIDMPSVCILVAAILQVLEVIPCTIADLIGNNAPWQITLVSVAQAGLIFLLGFGNYYLLFTGVGLAVVAGIVAGILIKTGRVTLPVLADSDKDALDLLQSAVGIVLFELAIYDDAHKDNLDDWQKTSALLLPLPKIVSFLKFTTYRDDPEVAPFAMAGNAFFDYVGYIGGGACKVVDALEKMKYQHSSIQ